MRKIIYLLLMCSLVCITGWASPFEEKEIRIEEGRGAGGPSTISGTVHTPGARLNIRTGAWGKVVGQLGHGSRVTIVGSSGDWYKIAYKGSTRYVHKNYVSTSGQKASGKAPVKGVSGASRTGTVDTNGYTLNVRSGPWGTVVGSLRDNAKVTIVGQSGDWYKISYNGKTRYVHKKYVKSGSQTVASKPKTSGSSSSNASTYKASVIGDAMGDGSVAGAITWSRDQINGTKRGYNVNNGLRSSNPKAWAGWCLAFVNTSYGRKKPLLAAPSAIQSYYKCKAAGKIVVNKNPPAGAVMFTGTGPGNPYGHIFMATGKMHGPNDPIIITTTSYGVKEMPLSQMWKGPKYLGWAMP